MNEGQQAPYRSASYDRFLMLVSLRGYRFDDLQDRFSMPLDTILAVVENKVFGDISLLYNVSMDLCKVLGDDYHKWFKSLVRDRSDKRRSVSLLAIGHAQPSTTSEEVRKTTYEVRQTPTAVKRNGSKTLSVHGSYGAALDALDLEGLTSKRVLLVVKINSDATEDVMAIADHRR